MEPRPDSGTTIVLADDKKSPGKKKHGGAMGILRVALFVWRRRGSRKRSKAALQVEVATASAEMLNKVVGSMRPLHAKGGESPPHVAATAQLPPPQPQPQPQPAETLLLPGASLSRSEQYEDVASASSASDGSTSRYSSALNLQELEKSEGGCSPGGGDAHDHDVDAGDDMIDLKAEEFIARFYEQMRIQNQNEMVRGSVHGSW